MLLKRSLNINKRLLIGPKVCLFSSNNNISAFSDKDYYSTLQISKSATPQQIRASFFALAKKYHPDLNKEQDENSKEIFQKINEAYQILSDEKLKSQYDKMTGNSIATNTSKSVFDAETAKYENEWTKIFNDVFGTK